MQQQAPHDTIGARDCKQKLSPNLRFVKFAELPSLDKITVRRTDGDMNKEILMQRGSKLPAGAAGVVLVILGAIATAQQQPATQPAAQPPAVARDRDPVDAEFVISPMRVQELPAMTYLYASFETTFAEMGEPIRATMQTFEEAIRNGQMQPSAAPVFIYHGATHDPAKKFTLDIGFPVDENAKEFADFKVKKTEPFRCATVIYSGPIRSVVNAYQQVFADLMAAGLEPTGESREMYMYWEGEESVNNVTLIQIGVK